MKLRPAPSPPLVGQCTKCHASCLRVWMPLGERWVDDWCTSCRRAEDAADVRLRLRRDDLLRAGFGVRQMDDVALVTPDEDQLLVANWEPKPGSALLISGGVGTGKTVAGALLTQRQLVAGRRVVRVEFPRLMRALQNGIADPKAPDAVEARMKFRKAQSADVTIVDDVGVGGLNAWAREQLFAIVDHRYEHATPLVLVTNLELDNERLDMALGPQITSRLAQMTAKGLIVTFVGPDRRQQAER